MTDFIIYDSGYIPPNDYIDLIVPELPSKYSGDGVLFGKVEVNGIKQRGKIRIVDSKDGLVVSEFMTNDLGEWSISNISRGAIFDIIAFVEGWQPKVISNVRALNV